MICVLSSILLLLWLSAPWSVNLVSAQVQIIDFKVLEGGDDGQCASVEEREEARNEIHQIVTSVIADTFSTTPIASTTVVPSSTINSATTMSTTDSTATHPTMIDCNGSPGWKRVVFINMTDTSYDCPTGLNLTSYSKRTCGRLHTTEGCSSTTFNVGGLSYSRVCGRIRGYQFWRNWCLWS